MPNIFDYLDYRRFLADYYQEQKKANPAFSYLYFARKAGHNSKSFLPHLIEGTRNLSQDAVFKVKAALKLNDKAFSYFRELVAFNQAPTPDQRNYHLERLMQYNRRNPARRLLARQYEFYAQWYHNTVRDLATMANFGDNHARLGRNLMPPITTRQARASVALLLKLGLIKRRGRRYELTHKVITTGDETRSVAVRNFHVQNLQLAAKAIDSVPAPERDMSCVVARLSDKGFSAIKAEVQQFRKRLMAMIEEDKDPQRVYHISMQLFPTTQPITRKVSP
jgi:uncharacterized protein (TIGR02147 family)